LKKFRFVLADDLVRRKGGRYKTVDPEWLPRERMLVNALHPKQRAAALDSHRRVADLTGRGCGKTTKQKARYVRKMGRIPKSRNLYIAKTREQAEELMWNPLKETHEKLEIQAHYDETFLKCTLKNGSFLRLVGCDDKKQVEKLRGQPFHEVGIDETASIDPRLLHHLIFRIIGPRLGDFGGCLVLSGTPGHILSGPFYEATRIGSNISRDWEDRDRPDFQDWKGWSTHRWCLKDGAPYVPAMARLWDEALIEKAANGWSDTHPIWLREYMGQWAADDSEMVFRYRPHAEDGSQWNQWSPERDAKGFAKLPPGDWNFVYGMDLGSSDPFALNVFAFRGNEKILYHVYEFERREMFARPIAQLLLGEELNHENPTGLLSVTGWPDAMVAGKEHLGGALFDELAQVYGIRLDEADRKDKHDTIELFNGDLQDGRIKILKDSKLEHQLLNLQWKQDDWGKLKEDKSARNDHADSALYARKRAKHLFADDPQPVKPLPGSMQAREQALVESEEAAAGIKKDGFENYLGDDSYDSFFS
jgi:hypothetical protein